MNIFKITFAATFFILMLFFVASTIDINGVSSIASVIGSQKRPIYAQCITAYSDAPQKEFDVTHVDLNGDSTMDALVKHNNEETCGNAGCIYELCVSDSSGNYEHVPFGFAAQEVTLEETTTEGMKDLMLNNDERFKMIWNGSRYVLDAY